MRGKNLANNVLFFDRIIEDIEEHIKENPTLAAKFIDLDENNNIDLKSKQLLNDLKYNKISSKLPSSNIFKLKTKWTKEGISINSHLEYVQSFGNLFYEQVKRLIDKNYMQSNNEFHKLNELDQILLQEVLYHAHFCNQTVTKFHGREDVLYNIKEYILSDSRVPFVVYGESGCGKTAILAKTTSQILSYVPNPFNYTIILRFLGTTPTTSNISQTYCSIIHQISRLFNIKIQIQFKDANKPLLKDYLMFLFRTIKNLYPKRRLVIILDSLDQLASNDYDLEWMIEKFSFNVKMIYSTLPQHGSILNMLQMKPIPKQNFIHLVYLNIDLAILILKDWLNKIDRSLSVKQWSLIETMLSKAVLYPLYIKIIFDIITKWHSYHEPDRNFLSCLNIDSTIRYLFELLEIEHGKLLFSRAIIYMTSFRDGISESEIEDILSLDDEVLYDIFEYHAPPLRKLPSALWTRIKHDLQNYLVEKEVDDTRVIYWYHRRFIEVTNSYYIGKLSNKEEVFTNVVDFFNETWKHKPKPFKYNKYLMKKKKLNSEIAEEIRETSVQKTVYIGKDKTIHYNKRKLKELPNFVSQLNPSISMQIACKYIYLDYQFLSGMFSICSYNEIVANLGKISLNHQTYSLGEAAKQAFQELMIFNILLLQCMVAVKKYPESAGLQIVSRSLIFYGTSKYITDFIDQYDAESSFNCALIVPHQIQQPPGSDTIFSLEKHTEPIKCVSMGGIDLGVIFSLSNKLNFVDFNSSNTFETNYDLESTEHELQYLIVYVLDAIPLDKTLKEFDGGFLVASQNEIISYSFDMSVYFRKKFTVNTIIQLDLITKNHILIAFKHGLEIFNIYTGDLVKQINFENEIKFMKTSLFHKNIKIQKYYDIEDILVLIVLESNEIYLYNVEGNLKNNDFKLKKSDDISLHLIKKWPYSGLVCESVFLSDNKTFLLVFEHNVILKITLNNYFYEHAKNTFRTETQLIRLNLDEKIKFEIKFCNKNQMVLIGSNGSIYHLFHYYTRISELKGNYDDGFIDDTNKMIAFSGGTVQFMYFENDEKIEKFAIIKEINIHFDKIISREYKNKMLTTASIDSTIKISTVEGINVNLQYMKFDKCEKEIRKLIQLESEYLATLMTNSNHLNFWKASNGKIIKRIELEKNEIIEDCFMDKFFILVSNLVDDECKHFAKFCFVRGFQLNFMEEQVSILKFKIKIENGKNMKFFMLNSDLIILKEDMNVPILYMYKLNLNQLIKTKTDTIQQPNHGHIDLSDLLVISNNNSIIRSDNIAITHKHNLLVIYLNTELIFIDFYTKNILLCHKLNRINLNSVKYFLSPTNLALNNLNNLNSISNNSDTLIAQGNLNNLILINYDYTLQKLRILKTDDLETKRLFDSYTLNMLNILTYDKLNEELIGFKLNENNLNVFENITFKISISRTVIDSYGLSTDNKYVYVIEQKKSLRLFRNDEDSKKLGETILYSRINKITCSNEYISMGMQDNRIVSFLIVDPSESNSSEKIKNLESRSKEITKDNPVSKLENYFEHDYRVLNYDQIFNPSQDYGKDELSLKLIKRFNDIRNTTRECLIRENFVIGCLTNKLDSDWAVDLIKKNPIFETNEIRSDFRETNSYEICNAKEFKQELFDILTAKKLIMKAKNTSKISITNNSSKACVIQ